MSWGGHRKGAGRVPGEGARDHTFDHIVATEDVKRRRGVAMHSMDILEIYRARELKQEGDPEDEKEKQRRELLLWQTVQEQKKYSEDKAKERLQVIKIRHDLLDAVKRAKELEFKEMLKPKPEVKKEPVIIRPIVVSVVHKKKKASYIY